MPAQSDNSQLSTLNAQLLKQYWGYDSFRGIQEEIINSISENKDTLGLMPTGGGKSITFQVPALAKDGLCLVITPLIALMKDQVQNLRKRGIKALSIYSGMSRQDIITTLENCIFGNYKFLYISPERLDTEIFRTKLRKMKVSMITVDESHCISQWGYDFRPAYLKIAEIRELLPDVPVLALTCLLYTSPSPRDLPENRRNTSIAAGRPRSGPDRHRHPGSSERHPGPPAFPSGERFPHEL